MSENMTDVVERLQAEESRLVARVQEFRAGARTAEAELERVRTALGALSGKQKARRGRSSKPSVTQEEVVSLVRDLLASGPIPEDELKKRASDTLRASGRSLSGFALRFRQALDSDGMAKQGDLVRLE